MDIQARKYKVIEKVMHMSADQLEKIETLLDEEKALSAALDQAMQQVKEGKGRSHSEVRKKYERWL